jgi:hypothetical protein
MFSPLKDQPQYVFTARGLIGQRLLDLERQLPGVLAYGHFHQDRTWYRLKKMVDQDGAADLDIFDYYDCYVPLNCAWLFEHELNDLPAGAEWEVKHAINVADIFAWPSEDPEALAEMAEYGRVIVQQMIDTGEVRPFVADLITDYQARGVYWASTRPFFKFVYPCGCLTGDTVLTVNRGGKAFRLRLDELVRKFNGGLSRGRRWSSAPTRVQSMDEQGHRMLNTVDVAVCSGEKEVFEVYVGETVSGEGRIKASKDHRFWTPKGWRRLYELSPGDKVAVMWPHGRRAWPEILRRNRPSYGKSYAREGRADLHHHPFASTWWCGRDNRENATVYVHRLVAEARVNGLTYDELINRVCTGDLDGLELLDPRVWHVHHRDHDIKNNATENLEVLTVAAHARLHGDKRHVSPRRQFVEIISITSKGTAMTYDLAMAAPHHNFIANSFVVHNSGKTLVSILAACIRPGPVCIIAPAKARRVWWDQVQEYTAIVPHRVIPAGQMRRGDETLADYLLTREARRARKFVIFGAQSLPDHTSEIQDLEPTALIFDELHTFGQAKRWTPIFDKIGEVSFKKKRTVTDTRETRAVAAMDMSRLPSIKLRGGLSATPLDDGRTRRLWSQLDLLAPGGFGMGFRPFAFRYCDATPGDFGGLEDKGSSNVTELKMRASYIMQEVTHTESHGQLPPTRTQVIWLDPSDQNRPAAFRRVITKAEKLAHKTGTAFDKERALEANLMEAASRKRTFIIEEAIEGLRGGGKVVLFTARRQDCEDWASFIEKALKKEVAKGNFNGVMPDLWWGHGGVDERDREDMVDRFRESEGPCILIGTGQAFGESVDGLQTASLAIFAMLPWRPGDFEQWKGRFDRLGGVATLLKVILAKRTYDEKVAGILADKMGPIKEYLEAEQYKNLDDKLLGLDNHDAMRASILTTLFGATA